MNILKKLTIKNLSLNKKRAVGTVIGIILSVALICAVAGMFVSLRATLVENTINEYGYYHVALEGINKEKYENLQHNKDVKNILKLYSLGHAVVPVVGNDEGALLQVYSTERKDLDDLKFKLEEGKYPASPNEIVLSKPFMSTSNFKVGDTIELDVGRRKTNDGYDLNDRNPFHPELERLENTTRKKYKIVGVISRANWGRVYYGMTTGEVSDNLKAYVALKKPADYKTSIPEILEAANMDDVNASEDREYAYCTVNNELLRWEVFKFSDSTLNMLYAVGGVVIIIIIISSVFCIRNSFAISTLEKMKMYGMLASVGATKKQIRKSVIYEGLTLGLIGVPIGILSGIFADFVLIKVVNLILGNALFNYISGLVFKVSFTAIGLSVVLGFVTIYLSSIFSAIKAGKVSPIDNLRSSNEIKISTKKLRTPKIVSGLFKTGGTLAYKNLNRSKKKYRTTVISLTISILVFISMSAFINETFRESAEYYTDFDYTVEFYNASELTPETLAQIRNLKNYEDIFLVYESRHYIEFDNIDKIATYEDDGVDNNDLKRFVYMGVLALDDDSFRAYADKLKVSYDDVKNKGILVDDYRYYSEDNQIEKRVRRYKYNKGDIINGVMEADDVDKKVNFEVGAVTRVKPYGYEQTYYSGGYLVLNRDVYGDIDMYLDKLLVNVDDTEKYIKELKTVDDSLGMADLKEIVRNQKAMLLVVSIFLYGFIAVITLIGVTNIFNTITYNMELRSKEFAMLKSIGMTKKEFNRMVNLETIFYSSKSLLYGIVLGLIGAYYVHKGFASKAIDSFMIPTTAIIISIVFVFVIVSLIMKYSIKKINKLNTIETIRNENI